MCAKRYAKSLNHLNWFPVTQIRTDVMRLVCVRTPLWLADDTLTMSNHKTACRQLFNNTGVIDAASVANKQWYRQSTGTIVWRAVWVKQLLVYAPVWRFVFKQRSFLYNNLSTQAENYPSTEGWYLLNRGLIPPKPMADTPSTED